MPRPDAAADTLPWLPLTICWLILGVASTWAVVGQYKGTRIQGTTPELVHHKTLIKPSQSARYTRPHPSTKQVAKAKALASQAPKVEKSYRLRSKAPGSSTLGARWVQVNLAKQRLYVMEGKARTKVFVVSTGLYNRTPTGRFRIVEKMADPPYYGHGISLPPGVPGNPMGPAWLGLNWHNPTSGFPIGIHGTNHPEYLGQQASAGCIRVSSASVKQLFDLVAVGTEVVIE